MTPTQRSDVELLETKSLQRDLLHVGDDKQILVMGKADSLHSVFCPAGDSAGRFYFFSRHLSSSFIIAKVFQERSDRILLVNMWVSHSVGSIWASVGFLPCKCLGHLQTDHNVLPLLIFNMDFTSMLFLRFHVVQNNFLRSLVWALTFLSCATSTSRGPHILPWRRCHTPALCCGDKEQC